MFDDLEAASRIDAIIRLRLADSLAHIFSRAKSHLHADPDRVETTLDHIRTNRQHAGVFARYYDLVFAVKTNEFRTANQLLSEIIGLSSQSVEFVINSYDRKSLGDDFERYPRLLFAEYGQVNPMARPSMALFSASASRLREAMAIVQHVDKAIYAELTDLLVCICVAVGSKSRRAREFGGVTSFMIWGASFMNAEAYRTRREVVQFLVHEITHSLLFGVSCDEPLVLNDPAESYASPLRHDRRPMDGIYHASLVCARLAAFNKSWLDSGLVEPGERNDTEQTVAQMTERFRNGLGVIQQHGKLSAQGRHLLEQSCTALCVTA